MNALDSNILLRFFAADDPVQSPRARRLLVEELTSANPGYISLPVIVELAWVLQRAYRRGEQEVRGVIRELLAAPNLIVQQADAVRRAVDMEGTDFADALIHKLGEAAGCVRTLTFDQGLARHDSVELLA